MDIHGYVDAYFGSYWYHLLTGVHANIVNSCHTLTSLIVRLDPTPWPLIQSELHPYVVQYDDLVDGPLSTFHKLSSSIGGAVKTMGDMVFNAIRTQRQFLLLASRSKQPTRDILINLLKPTDEAIQSIQAFREKNRTTEWFNHLSAISESISALGWVTVAPTPGPFVKEMKDAAQFYTNKVLVSWKDKDRLHVDWTKSWIEFLTQLQAYIKDYHTTGLTWNIRGADVSPGMNGASFAPPPPPRGGPPPPPPPPSTDFMSAEASAAEDARLQLMKDLSMGTDITGRLKRVTADQQTHKNPALKASSVVPASAARSGTASYAGQKAIVMKPPKFELEGKKWLLEYINGRKDIVIEGTEMNQSINLYKCVDTIVQVKGKVNSITVDSCSKTAVVFEDIVSVVEFINCQSIQAQVNVC